MVGMAGVSRMSNLFTLRCCSGAIPPPSPAQAPLSAMLTSRPLTKGRSSTEQFDKLTVRLVEVWKGSFPNGMGPV